MPLKSRYFAGDPALEACLQLDPAHITPSARGPHVVKIQTVLEIVDGASIAQAERDAGLYGSSTAAAVLAYKKKRNIINRSYQTTADNIVGKLTIAALDADLLALQEDPTPGAPGRCRGRSLTGGNELVLERLSNVGSARGPSLADRRDIVDLSGQA